MFSKGEKKEYVVDKIVDKREGNKGVHYLVCWKGYKAEKNTWVSQKHGLENCGELVKEYEMRVEASGKTPLTTYPQHLTPKGIVACSDANSGIGLHFLMEWKEKEDLDLIPEEMACKHCPKILLDFYESQIDRMSDCVQGRGLKVD